MLQKVADAVRLAGQELLKEQEYGIHQKSGEHDYVTDMDLKMQEMLRGPLTAIMPDAAFLSEEDLSMRPEQGQYYWLLDPIDGTSNFILGLEMSCISVALCRDNEPVLAAVYNPWRKEMFLAEKGKGASLNGKPIHVSERAFGDAVCAFGQGYGKRVETHKVMGPLIEQFYTRARNLRAIGCAELAACYVAAGRMDVYCEQQIMPWDYVAGKLIVQEAGGVATDWSGGELPLSRGSSALIANSAAYKDVLAITAKLL